MAPRTYMDHNATAPLRPEARDAMVAALDRFGNASSVHSEGRQAHAVLEQARESVAVLINAKPSEIVFTSGATEANNMVLRAGWDTIVVAAIEHESVLAPARASGARLVAIPVDSGGRAEIGAVADHVLVGSTPLGRDLVSLQLANSETGVLQDVASVGAFCSAHDVALHCDAVQAPGRVPIDVAALDVDYLTISAHKMGGPKGVGAVYMREGRDLPPLLLGGGQERRRRAGTENISAIAGFGAAARAAHADLADVGRITRLRDRLEAEMKAAAPDDVTILCAGGSRLANTIAASVRGHKAETMVIKLDLAGVAVSAGSACSSGKIANSHVLAAMGIGDDVARGTIRVSLGWTSSDNDLEPFLTAWRALVAGGGVRAVA